MKIYTLLINNISVKKIIFQRYTQYKRKEKLKDFICGKIKSLKKLVK